MKKGSILFVAAAVILPAGGAYAKPAQCFTTDDGHYACDFRANDRQGSFTITADGKPTYILVVDEPGTAFGYLNMGDRNVALPGTFQRERADPACWRNTDTDVRVCAW
ncbi:MAG TPA: hypothetical protein VGN97_03975 [Mesorhizobium sp.]|jgi:hypothetical protein|nr:hypothetical protein [Mesorhizobium sp.]